MEQKPIRIDFHWIKNSLMILLFLSLLFPALRFWFYETGGRWAYILLFSLSLSYSLIPPIKFIALRKNILDIPDYRKIHKTPIPLLGGLAIFIAFLTSLLVNNIFYVDMWGIMFGASIVAIVGIIDDKRSVRARYKLIWQIVAVTVTINAGISLTLFPDHGFWKILNILLTFLWVIGITNSMNFFDGMDGLATGLSIIISVFLGILAYQNYQPSLGWPAVALLGSCLGFLPYNFRLKERAGIFLGDSGSTFLGFTLACLAIRGDWSEGNPLVSAVAPLLVFGILIYDMVYTSVERFASGKVKNLKEFLEYVGKDHLHHRIDALLENQKYSVLFIFALNISLGIAAIVLRQVTTRYAVLLALQGVIFLLIITILERTGNKRMK